MPDLEISNLPALAEAGVSANDPLAIADVSASETKKVTVKDLIEAGVALIDTGSIPSAKVAALAANQVATAAIQDDAVTNAKLEHSTISLGGISIALGGTDATPAFNLADATGYTTANLSGTISNAQLAGSIANNKLANSSVSFGGISLALGGTDATPAFDLTDATGYKTTNLVGTITNAQLAGSIDVSKLTGSSISLGGVSIALGGTDATPAFNLTDATGYPTSALVGTITNTQLAGSIANSKLANSSVSIGGVSVALGGTDATPAFNLSDATGYPTSALVGTITNAQLAGSIDVSKLAGSTAISLGGVSIALGGTDATPAFNLSDATHYPTSALVGTITNAQLAGSIANAKLTNSSVSFGGVSVALGASDATPAFDLTDAAGYKTTSLVGTITNAQLAGSIAVSKLVSSNISLGGVSVTLGTADATPAFDLQDATGYPTSALVGTITNAQLAGSIAATKLVSGSITSTQLAANSVTDSELANNAVDTGAVQNGAITNDKVETSTNSTTGLDGATKIRDASITPAKLNTSNLDRSINVASGNLGINNAVSGGASTRSGISYNAEGLITGTVALAGSDLPNATTSAVGGVSVGAGLSVTGAGALSITNSITANTSGAVKVTYNAQGQITGSSTLAAGDIPTATTSAKGAVQITSGGGLTVDGSGNLTTSTSGVGAGTYQSVTVDAKGVVTAGAALTASQIPDLAATKITSGTIDAARIGADSIDGTKLSNTSTALFQSIAQQGYPTAQFNGQILFDTVSEDAFIWDGNAWQAITTLTKGSLVFGGNYNANTSKMTACTTAGLAAGLAVGSNLPTPSSTTDGLYVVVDTAGTPSAPAPVVAFSPPDYILGVTNTTGSSWNEIDLSQTVAGQVASNITFTPYGQLSSTNVQDALQELETEKMGFAGGTLTGQLLIGNTGSLVFEGSTIDAYETTITVADPTSSDKTITFPDTTGTVITSGDTNTVNSTMVNNTLTNANLATDADIAFSKLADLTSAQILVGNGSNVPTAVAVTGDISINNAGLTAISAGVIVNADISNSAAITGSKVSTGTTSAVGVLQLTDSATSTSATTAATPAAATTANAALPKAGGTMTDNLIIDNGKELRLSESDSDGTNYTGLKAQAQSGDITLTLPAVAPTAGQVLKADASTPTTLTWAADSATDNTKMPLAGGTFTNDVTFTGDASNGLWDKSESAFVANLTGNVTGNVTGNASGSSGSCTGNAATATALATARTIGGVSFDGTANINLPGVNASGTQDTSGTAALATEFTVTANNSTDETVYPLFVDGATGSQGAETDSALTYNPSTGALNTTTFIGDLTGNVTGNVSGTSGGFTAGNASNLNSGTVATARLGSGTASSSNFLRGDNTWQTIDLTALSASNLTSGTVPDARFPATLPAVSGVNLTALNASNLGSGTVATARLGSGTASNSTFLRGDGSWQTVDTSAAGSDTQVQFNNSGAFAGSSSLTFNSGTGALTATSFVGALTGNVTGNVTGNASGSSGSCTGNAATATALATARTINAVSFDGTADILVPKLLPSSGQSGTAIEIIDSGSNAHVTIDLDGGEEFRFTSGGRLLVGTTVTSGTPAVGNQIILASSGNGGMTILGGNTHDGHIFFADTDSSLQGGISYNHDGDYFYFRAAGDTERFRISSTGAAVTGSLTISGDLTVNGTTTTIDTTTLQVEDKNIEIGKVSSPSDTTADGGGLTLKGASDKTFNWVNSTDAWTSSEHIQVASGKTFIGDGSTLTALNASNISSGTIAAARVPTLNQNTTGNAATATALATARTIGGSSFDGTGDITVDAATLDGIDSASFLRSDADDTTTGKITINNSADESLVLSGSNDPYIRFKEGSTEKAYIQWSSAGYLYLRNQEDSSGLLLRDDIVFSTDGSNWHKVWHAGNDGVGSGLNADLLDGVDSTAFLRSNAADSADGRIQFAANATSNWDDMASSTGSMGSIEVYNSGSGNDAFMAFHSGSDYALYFGLDADSNSLAVGGWSMGAVKHKIIHQGNVGSGDALSGVNVYANQFHGDGSNLTNLPAAGGTIQLTASGSITAYKGVIVNASGQVEALAGATAATGSRLELDSSTVEHTDSCALDTDKYVAVYQDEGDSSKGKAVIVTASGVTLSKGSASTFANGTTTHIRCCKVSTTTFAVLYHYNSYFRVRLGTVSGTSISWGTELGNVRSGTPADFGAAIGYQADVGGLLIVVATNYSSNWPVGHCAHISGTSIVLSSNGWFTVNSNQGHDLDIVENTTDDELLITWISNNQGNAPRYLPCKLSGSTNHTHTTGTNGSISGQNAYEGKVCYNSDDNVYAYVWRNQDQSNKISQVCGTPSGSGASRSVSWTDYANVYTASGSYPTIAYSSTAARYLIAFVASNGNGRWIKYKQNGTAIIADGSESTYESSYDVSNKRYQDICEIGGGNFVISYPRGTESFSAISRQLVTTNLKESNFLGFSSAGYTNGQTATINVVGNTIAGQSSLTPGAAYFVQGDGTISTSEGDPSVKAGVALSSTSLLIRQ